MQLTIYQYTILYIHIYTHIYIIECYLIRLQIVEYVILSMKVEYNGKGHYVTHTVCHVIRRRHVTWCHVVRYSGIGMSRLTILYWRGLYAFLVGDFLRSGTSTSIEFLWMSHQL